MNAKRKYELIILAIVILGAIVIGLLSLESLAIYFLVLLLALIPIYYYSKKVAEQTEKYVSKLTNRIKDSSEKGINKFPIGIIVIDENKNINFDDLEESQAGTVRHKSPHAAFALGYLRGVFEHYNESCPF